MTAMPLPVESRIRHMPPVRLTRLEYAVLVAAASEAGLSVSEFTRQALAERCQKAGCRDRSLQ